MRALMITAESSDWCGINEIFVFHTDIEDEEDALRVAIDKYSEEMEEHLFSEYYTDDEDDEDYIPIEFAGFSYSAEWFSKEVYGDINCKAYENLN